MNCNCVADCLCDVSIGAPAPIADIDFGRDSYYAREIIRYLGLSVPFSVDDMLKFFEMQTRLKDTVEGKAAGRQTHFKDGRVNPTVAKARVTTEVRDFIAVMVRRDERTGAIRQAVKEAFGIELSSHYTSVLRKRVMAD